MLKLELGNKKAEKMFKCLAGMDKAGLEAYMRGGDLGEVNEKGEKYLKRCIQDDVLPMYLQGLKTVKGKEVKELLDHVVKVLKYRIGV